MGDSYSHSAKAGNEGDVAKHPVLVAAVNGLLDGHAGSFRYADTFAGSPMHRLRPGGEWEGGIGRFTRGGAPTNPDLMFWTEQWAATAGAWYPGSSLVVRMVLEHRGVPFEGRLWDTDGGVVEALERAYPHGGPYRSIRGVARPEDFSHWRPDLLFIDPPRLYPTRSHYPDLKDLLGFLEVAENLLIWLPMRAAADRRGGISHLSNLSLDAWRICLARGMSVRPIRWAPDSGFVGCLLAFRLPEGVARRVQGVADAVVAAMGWTDLSASVLKPGRGPA